MVDFKLVEKLKYHGFTFDRVLDIGAHKGEWTKKFKEYYPDVESIMIEANQNHAEYLAPLGKFYTALLGKNNENADYYTCTDVQNNHGNGIYKENSNVPFQIEKRKMITLDSLLPNEKFDLIKMDVQGAELDIMQGSPIIIHNTKYLWLELQVHHYNIGAPISGKVISYLDQIGFEIFEIAEARHAPSKEGPIGPLLNIDLLFINSRNKSLKNGPYDNTHAIRYRGYND
jgi:FkbM family methyltransferase